MGFTQNDRFSRERGEKAVFVNGDRVKVNSASRVVLCVCVCVCVCACVRVRRARDHPAAVCLVSKYINCHQKTSLPSVSK